MGERTAVVVGGGISGLAAGIALSQRGWRVRVLERAAEFTEVGAGISLWSNALRALDTIGVGERIRASSGEEPNAGLRHQDGRWLMRVDSQAMARQFGPVLILHRADLLRTLVEAVPAGSLVSSVDVTAVGPAGSGSTRDGAVEVVSSAGTETADLVIGADGIRSAVRASIWPDGPQPRYAGYTAWRLVTPEPFGPMGEVGESWGRGARFGCAPLPDGRVYCYATANEPETDTAGDSAGDHLADLRARFADWHDPIPALLAAADTALRHDLYELPDLPTYVQGRVALVGDAAHAMTPNLGQGACQALEDVATLVALLDRYDDVPTALARYDEARRRHTQSVVRQSRLAGAMGQWSGPVSVAIRDRLVRLVPTAVMTRSISSILGWRLPS